jgi:P4 family phage/plasmid primase-like protien
VTAAVDPVGSGGAGYDEALVAAVEGYLALGWKLFVIPALTESGRKSTAGNCRACDTAGPGHDMESCSCLMCHGFYAATAEPARLAEMFRAHRGGQLAVRTGAASGIVVIDAEGTTDKPHEPTGVEVLDSWEMWAGGFTLPATARAVTPSGGVHLIYRTGSDASVRQRNRVLPNVDVKGESGYVVLPPDRAGARRWLGIDGPGVPSAHELREPTPPLWSWLRTVKGGRGSSGGGGESGDSVGHSGAYDYDAYLRDGPPTGVQSEFLNDRLFRLIAHQGIDDPAALFAVVWPEVETWEQRVGKPWLERDVRSKIDSMVRSIPAAEPLPTWRPAVIRRDGAQVGGSFTTEPTAENVIAVDFGGEGGGNGGDAAGAGAGDAHAGGDGGADDPREVPAGYDGHRAETYDDTGNAHRFARIHRERVRYVADIKTWLVWNGVRWARDRTNAALDLTLAVVDEIEAEAEAAGDDGDAVRGHARATRARNARKALLELAASVPHLAVTAEQLDTNPEILVVENGVIDLRTGAFARPRPEDLCTLSAAVRYDPAATCPRWEAHIRTVTCGDIELAAYLQRLAGYTLTGLTKEQAFFSLEGDGANGKNVFIEPIMFLMGEYATVASSKLVTQGDKSHAAILADLVGARMVFVDEIPQGKHVDVERVKTMTGSARMKAQFMRENWFFFKPQMKLWIAGNEQPRFKDSSDGIWRRMKRILFNAKIPDEKKILDYAQVLYEEEGAGILNWCLAGLRAWRELGGLGTPQGVRDAVAELRSDEDHIVAFMEECVDITTVHADWVTNAQVYQVYTTWCDANGVARADRLNGVHLGRRFAALHGVERFNKKYDGKQRRGLAGMRLTESALSVMGSAL